MRRKDREVTDFEQILQIVKKCEVCHVAMICEGAPYVVPMNFGWAVENGRLVLYLHSMLLGQKLDALQKDPRVCFEMETDGKLIAGDIPCQYSYLFSSVIGSGKVEFVEDVQAKKRALDLLMHHHTGEHFEFTERMTMAVKVWRIEAQTLTGKRRTH